MKPLLNLSPLQIVDDDSIIFPNSERSRTQFSRNYTPAAKLQFTGEITDNLGGISEAYRNPSAVPVLIRSSSI